MFSLLSEHWIPVRRRDGRQAWISPSELSDPEIVTFDAPRPDFNAALRQFAVALLQTTCESVQDSVTWRKKFREPPTAEELQQWFEAVKDAFIFDGDGFRFMQDKAICNEAAENDISALFIEVPGEQTLKQNKDLFVKRGGIQKIDLRYAVMALLTLQLNAPAGGAGHRTGLRGGGPLTTLLVPVPANGETPSLWQQLWLNVQPRPVFLLRCGDVEKTSMNHRFPWMGELSAIQGKDKDAATAPVQVHPDHILWAMPRRIWLDLTHFSSGVCDVSGEPSGRLVSKYTTRNYGLNYKGAWRHPLSPYNYNKKEGWLPMHPQPGGFGYRHWAGWVLSQGKEGAAFRRADAVGHVLEHGFERERGRQLQLHLFGYDMDNMKARGWYESFLPLYNLAQCDADAVEVLEFEVGRWVEAAELVALYLRGAVKEAWFSVDMRGDLDYVPASFWARTEPLFYRSLQGLIDRAAAGETVSTEEREAWLTELRKAAQALFDNTFVGTGRVEQENPRRIAAAWNSLKAKLNGPKLREAMGLPKKQKESRK